MTVLEKQFMEQVPSLLRDISKSLKAIAGNDTAREPECVWVFTADQVYDFEACDVVVKVFTTEDAARKFLQDFVHDAGDDSIENQAMRNGWEIDASPDVYCAYCHGSYSSDHVECTITKCQIEK